jgi:hypothetical protein
LWTGVVILREYYVGSIFLSQKTSFITMKAPVWIAARIRVSMSELSSRSGVICVPIYWNKGESEMKLLCLRQPRCPQLLPGPLACSEAECPRLRSSSILRLVSSCLDWYRCDRIVGRTRRQKTDSLLAFEKRKRQGKWHGLVISREYIRLTDSSTREGFKCDKRHPEVTRTRQRHQHADTDLVLNKTTED